MIKSSEDYIESIYCRNHKNYSVEDGKKVEYEEAVIKVRHNESEVLMVLYLLDKDQEVTWLSGSKNSEVFYNS